MKIKNVKDVMMDIILSPKKNVVNVVICLEIIVHLALYHRMTLSPIVQNAHTAMRLVVMENVKNTMKKYILHKIIF